MFSDDCESCGDLYVCSDCMLADVNGEHGERPADLPPVWSAIPHGYTAFPGGSHNDSCDALTRGESDCDCSEVGFVRAACNACGDVHHGDRFTYTLYRATLAHARREHARAIRSAALIRADRARYPSGMLDRELTVAGQWRRFIADRHDERRISERWAHRMRAAA